MTDTSSLQPPQARNVETADLGRARIAILASLASAVQESLTRLARSGAGESCFGNDLEAKIALELVRQLHRLLPMLPQPPAPPPPPRVVDWPLIPSCPLCGQGPGAHWPRDCPLAKSFPPEIRAKLK